MSNSKTSGSRALWIFLAFVPSVIFIAILAFGNASTKYFHDRDIWHFEQLYSGKYLPYVRRHGGSWKAKSGNFASYMKSLPEYPNYGDTYGGAVRVFEHDVSGMVIFESSHNRCAYELTIENKKVRCWSSVNPDEGGCE